MDPVAARRAGEVGGTIPAQRPTAPRARHRPPQHPGGEELLPPARIGGVHRRSRCRWRARGMVAAHRAGVPSGRSGRKVRYPALRAAPGPRCRRLPGGSGQRRRPGGRRRRGGGGRAGHRPRRQGLSRGPPGHCQPGWPGAPGAGEPSPRRPEPAAVVFHGMGPRPAASRRSHALGLGPGGEKGFLSNRRRAPTVAPPGSRRPRHTFRIEPMPVASPGRSGLYELTRATRTSRSGDG